jgi:hypothetical protein
MPKETNDLPPPVNHVFVDYENVHAVDPTIVGSKMVHVSLLLGAKRTKLDATVVEKLMQHVATVEMIRLTSPGRNALDFALAYYLGRAVLADPGGYFHIVSKDKGYDALIEHLRSKHIFARRHEDFTTLRFSATGKPSAATPPVAAFAAKPSATPKTPASLGELETRVLEYLRKPTTKRPRTENKLVSHLISHLGKKVTEAEVLRLVEMLSQAGKLAIGDKGRVTYYLDQA